MDPKDLPDITNNGPNKSKLGLRNWFKSLNEDPTFGDKQDEISTLPHRPNVGSMKRAASEPPFTEEQDISVTGGIFNTAFRGSTPAFQRRDAILPRRSNERLNPSNHISKLAVLETTAADKYLGTAATASYASREETLPPFIIHPLHPWYRFWWNLTVVVAAITSILEPYTIAFTPPGLYPYGSATSVLEYTCIILIAMDMVVSFNVAVYRNGVLITDRKVLAKKYLKLIFIVDLISIIPFDEIALAIAGLNGPPSPDKNEIVAQYYSLLKLLRMLRCYRLLWFFSFLTLNLAAPLLLVTLLRNVYFTFFLANFAACAFFFEARQFGFGPQTWVGSDPVLFDGASTSEMYIYSLYWSFATLSTTGYGDIAAYNAVEAGLIAFWMLFLIFFTAYIIGSITLLVVKHDESVGSYRDQMRSLQNYSTMHALPQSLRESMQRHLKLHFYNSDAADEHVLKVYPSSIRRKVLRQLYNPTLRECYLFQGARPRFLDAVLSVARVELYLPQVDILSSGDHVNELFIVAAGRLACACPQPRSKGTSGGGGTAVAEDTSSRRGQESRQSSFVTTNTAEETNLDSIVVNLAEEIAAAENKGPGSVAGASGTAGGPGSYFSTDDPSFHHGYNNSTHYGGTGHHHSGSIRFIEGGDAFGEVAFFTGTPQMETIRTQTTCRVLAISRAAFEQVAASFPSSKKMMLMLLSRREEDAALDLFPGPEGVSVFNKAMAEESRGGGGGGGGDGTDLQEDLTWRLNPQKAAELRLNLQQQVAVGSLLKLKGVVQQAVAKHDADRLTLWMYAAARGDVAKIREMMSTYGSNPNMSDYDQRTALMLASARGFRDVVSVLLAAGANPNSKDAFGSTALLEACKHGHDDVIDILVKAGAKLDGASGASSGSEHAMATLLCSTVHTGDLKLLRRLLRAGADVDSVDYDGRTALHIAASEGNIPAVELLVAEGGADIEKRDRWGATAVEEARRVGARRVEIFLLAEAEALLENPKQL